MKASEIATRVCSSLGVIAKTIYGFKDHPGLSAKEIAKILEAGMETTMEFLNKHISEEENKHGRSRDQDQT